MTVICSTKHLIKDILCNYSENIYLKCNIKTYRFWIFQNVCNWWDKSLFFGWNDNLSRIGYSKMHLNILFLKNKVYYIAPEVIEGKYD